LVGANTEEKAMPFTSAIYWLKAAAAGAAVLMFAGCAGGGGPQSNRTVGTSVGSLSATTAAPGLPTTASPAVAVGRTALSFDGFAYSLEIVSDHTDPNGVATTDTTGQPSLPPSAPGSTYAVVQLRIHNLQTDRDAPVPDPSQFPVGLAAARAAMPPLPAGQSAIPNDCYSGPGMVGFYLGDDPSQCDAPVNAVVTGGADGPIPANSSLDVTAYTAIPASVPLSDFRIVAMPGQDMTAAEFAAGASLR
jgi:hypothetical protein